MTRLRTFNLVPALLLVLFNVSARADLASSLTPAAQSSVGSNEVYFTGALTNSSAISNLYLNNIQITFTGAATNYLSADTNSFFGNVPGILLPGETYSDVVFGIAIAPSTPPGQYSGTVTFQGGTNIFAGTNLTTQAFQLTLSPAKLAILVSGTKVALSWPSPPGGFSLLVNSNLTSTNWLTITNSPSVTNGQNQVNLSPASRTQFYRLQYP